MTRRIWPWLCMALGALLLAAALGTHADPPPMDPGTPPNITTINH